MSTREPDPFIDALRDDLPTERDQARIRARLLAAGVIAGAGLAAPGVAAGGAVATGLLPKLLALPMFAKVGLAATVIGFSAIPVARHTARSEERPPATRISVHEAAPVPPATPTVAPIPERAAAPPSVEAPDAKPELPRERARSLPEFSREPSDVNTPSDAVPAVTRPAVGSFDTPSAPLDEGTLRAETALIEGALAALRAGDTARVRSLLAEHATRFPNGLLVRERQRALSRVHDATLGAADAR
jgi:hypothetical protein